MPKIRVSQTYLLKLLRVNENLEVLEGVVVLGVELTGAKFQHQGLEIRKVVLFLGHGICLVITD